MNADPIAVYIPRDLALKALKIGADCDMTLEMIVEAELARAISDRDAARKNSLFLSDIDKAVAEVYRGLQEWERAKKQQKALYFDKKTAFKRLTDRIQKALAR